MKLLQEIKDLIRKNDNYEDEEFADIWERDAEDRMVNLDRTGIGPVTEALSMIQATARLQMVMLPFQNPSTRQQVQLRLFPAESWSS